MSMNTCGLGGARAESRWLPRRIKLLSQLSLGAREAGWGENGPRASRAKGVRADRRLYGGPWRVAVRGTAPTPQGEHVRPARRQRKTAWRHRPLGGAERSEHVE